MTKTEEQNLLSSLLDTPIECNRLFAEITNLLTAGTLLTYLIRKGEKIDSAVGSALIESVALRDDIIQSELGLSDSEIYSAKRRLRHLKFIETKIQGHPIKTLYSCNRQMIQKAVVAIIAEKKTPTESNTTEPETYIQQRCNNNSKSKDINTVNDIRMKPDSTVNKNKERSRIRREFDYKETDTEYLLAKYLHDQIINRHPNFFGKQERSSANVKKKILAWAKEMDMIIHERNDGRDPEEAFEVLVWSQKDVFWQKVINSPYKFREKYGQLLDIKEGSNQQNQTKEDLNDAHPDITSKLIKMFCTEILSGRTPPWSTTDLGKFIRASRKISGFAKEAGLLVENVPKYLIQCLKSNFTDHGKPVYPGNLCSDNTWNILMPQYLRELGIVYKK